MPGTKPMGTGYLYVKAESTAFVPEAFAATDALRHIGIPSIGGHTREKIFPDISRGDRGVFHNVLGRYNDVEFGLELPFWGSGSAGTAVAARKALFESGAGLSETVSGGTSVSYESDVANPSETVSIYYVDRNATLGQYLIGAIVTSVGFEADKENIPKYMIAGKAARKWEFYKTTLGAAIATTDGTEIIFADSNNILTGDETTASLTGLSIYITIDSEHLKITAFNRATSTATVVRGVLGTSGATHSNGATVTPYAAAPTYGESGLLSGPMDWTFSGWGITSGITKINYTLNTGREFDPLSSGTSASNGIHNKSMEGSGSVSMILKNSLDALFIAGDYYTNGNIAVVVHTTAGSIHTLNLDAAYIINPITKDLASDGVAETTVDFKTLDTATALLGQFQIVET